MYNPKLLKKINDLYINIWRSP